MPSLITRFSDLSGSFLAIPIFLFEMTSNIFSHTSGSKTLSRFFLTGRLRLFLYCFILMAGFSLNLIDFVDDMLMGLVCCGLDCIS